MEFTGSFGGARVASRQISAPQPGKTQVKPKHRQDSWPTVEKYLAMPNEEMGTVDPVVMNLVVAKGIPAACRSGYRPLCPVGRPVGGGYPARSFPKVKDFYRTPDCW